MEQLLVLLSEAGFGLGQALHIYRAFSGFLCGHTLNELQEMIVDPEEDEAVLRLGLHRLPPKEFSQRRRLAPLRAEYDGAGELDQGLNILLSGLAAQLSPETVPAAGAPG